MQETDAGNRCRKQMQETDAGNRCRKQNVLTHFDFLRVLGHFSDDPIAQNKTNVVCIAKAKITLATILAPNARLCFLVSDFYKKLKMSQNKILKFLYKNYLENKIFM